MKRLLFALSMWLAVPFVSLAATGDVCTSPAAGVSCYLLVDVTSAGAFTAEFSVPNGGKNLDLAIVRAYRGTSAAGCGYDDVSIYTTTDTNAGTAGYELPLLGLLDDDGSSSGVKQILNFGPIGPVINIAGTATVGTCDASNPLQIQLLLYPKQIN